MRRGWVPAVAVLGALVAVVAYKETLRSDELHHDSPAAVAASPSVVLVADPREADSSCGCGEIIRMVRSANAEGVAVREVAPGSKESRDYHVTVNPTVLFLDSSGVVSGRYEGEGSDTIHEIRQQLKSARRR
jgi:hypothetical protein